MGTAIKRYLKQADWLGRPKWMVNRDSTVNDEDTVNDLYETAFTSPDEKLQAKALGLLDRQDPWQALETQARFNQYRARHTNTSDALLNRAKGLYSDDAFKILQKADRYHSLAKVMTDIEEKAPHNASIGKTLQFTPFGKKMQELKADISDYLFAPDSVHDTEKTAPEIAKRYKPTPYQMNRWLNLEAMDAKREARNSVWKYALGSGAAGALAGLGIGMIPPTEYGIGRHMTGTPGRAALLAAMLGGSSALIGGTLGYRLRLNDLRARKEWAKSHLKDAREWM